MAIKSSGIGSFCLARNRKPGGGFYPNWLVQFRLPDGIRERESSKLPICARCLVEEDALKARARCACIEEVKAWAAVRLEELVIEWKGDRLKPNKAEVKVKPLTLGEVAKVYRERGPAHKDECLQSLELVASVSLGRFGADLWETTLEELTPDLWRKFAWCYQELEQRGMTGHHAALYPGLRDRAKKEFKATAKAKGCAARMDEGSKIYLRLWKEERVKVWRAIRADMPENPDPDGGRVTRGNTTIMSHMRKAKSVLGKDSRDSCLWPVRERIPAVLYDEVKGWWACSIQLQVPNNCFALDRDVYVKMWDGMERLKQDDPEAWALIRLHWTTGVRPVEASQAKTKWLEQDPASGRVLLVIRNRFEDDRMVDGVLVKGFRMKDPTTRQERPWPLPDDLVEMLPRLASAGGSLLGCDTEYQWEKIYRRASAWLREMGVEGTQTLYNLRKLVATVKVANEGLEKAQVALGHAPGSTVTMGSYAGTSGEIRALSDADLSPERVMGGRRVAWVMPG